MRRLLLAALLLPVAVAAPAAAHTEVGTMEVLVAEQRDGLRAAIEVGVGYGDEHLADQATVTATVTHTSGATVGPVDLPQISGARYGTVLDLPTAGEWTLRATSTGPAAEATATFTVDAGSTSTTPEPDAEAAGAPEPDLPETNDAAWWVVAVPVLVVLAAIALYLGYRRRRD